MVKKVTEKNVSKKVETVKEPKRENNKATLLKDVKNLNHKTPAPAKEEPEKKAPFGGYSISFKDVKDITLEDVFGTKPMPPSEMTKRIWAYVKENELSNKPPKTPLENFEEYWDSTEYEDLEIGKFNALLVKCGATKKTLASAETIFKLLDKKPEEFQEQLDEFYSGFLKTQ